MSLIITPKIYKRQRKIDQIYDWLFEIAEVRRSKDPATETYAILSERIEYWKDQIEVLKAEG